jgi:hypothetical protein
MSIRKYLYLTTSVFNGVAVVTSDHASRIFCTPNRSCGLGSEGLSCVLRCKNFALSVDYYLETGVRFSQRKQIWGRWLGQKSETSPLNILLSSA